MYLTIFTGRKAWSFLFHPPHSLLTSYISKVFNLIAISRVPPSFCLFFLIGSHWKHFSYKKKTCILCKNLTFCRRIKGKVYISCRSAALVFPSQDFPDHTFLPLTYALLLRIPDSVPLYFRNSYLSLLNKAQECKNHHVEVALPSQTNCLHPSLGRYPKSTAHITVRECLKQCYGCFGIKYLFYFKDVKVCVSFLFGPGM